MTQDDFFRLLGSMVAELDYWKRRAIALEAQASGDKDTPSDGAAA